MRVILALQFVFVGVLAAAETQTPMDFNWNHGNSILASASKPEDFLQAAAVYQKMVNAGIRNGPLFYNLGTALLGAQRYDEAIQCLSRAERYVGHDQDILHNIRLALARRDSEEDASLPWYRFLLFWHYGLGISTRLALAAVSFSLCWVFLALRWTDARHWQLGFSIALLVCAVFGTSAFTGIHQETLDDDDAQTWLAPAEVPPHG